MIDENLLARTLAESGRGTLNIFAYGSLLWSPRFAHGEPKAARIFGYARRLCVYSVVYRGTPNRPGLVFGLSAGGSCGGMILPVAAAQKPKILRALFLREMFAGAYSPKFVRAHLNNGKKVRALAFVARPGHPTFAGELPSAKAAKIIRSARGKGGTCLEYVNNCTTHLQAMGIRISVPALAAAELKRKRTGRSF